MNRLSYFLFFLLVASALQLAAADKAPAEKKVPLAKPPLPAIKSLVLEPASLTLQDGRDVRRVLVQGKTASGELIDLTSEAAFKTTSANLEISDGFIAPKAKGDGEVAVSVAGLEARLPVSVSSAELKDVRFVRDVLPLMSKAGCNAGTCHGSAKGKNGFKLSLRGYDPEYDYQALINDLAGRRFNRVNPDQSLMLLKPVAAVPHEGGQVIKPDSRAYQILRQWIAEGTKYEDATQRADRIEVIPATVDLDLPGRTQQLLVLAHYPDDQVRDVTREAIFASNNSEVAEVKEGMVTGIRRGEAAIQVRYEGAYATKEITVMGDRSGFAWKQPPENNYIDKHVYTKLKRMKILPSELATDAEFMRRVSLDLTGQPPSGEQVRKFLENPSANKRTELIDELIGSQGYIEFWANKFADLLQCNKEALGDKGVWVYRSYIRQAIADNVPWDQFVRKLLLAQGSSYLNPEVNYYRVLREPGKIAEDVSQTFLGVRFNCNKCHDHPFEKWTQNQYYEFGAYFARVAFKRGSLGQDVIRNFTGDQMTVTGEEIVYRNYAGGEVTHPRNGKEVNPKVPFGTASDGKAAADRRAPFVDWLTSKENPLFARSMANRVWSYFFTRGIIDPVDDIRGSNPPSNNALLDALTEDFQQSGFDLRKLMRTICQSRTYQLSIIPNSWNKDDLVNYSHAVPRRLSAEQLLDALEMATGKRPKFTDLPPEMRSVQFPDGTVAGNDFLSLFGRPSRKSACECERTSNVTLSHALNLINGPTFGEAISASDNRIQKLVDSESDDKKLVEQIYYSCLSRPPTEKEMAAIDFSNGGTRLEVAQDLTWALLNSPAFLFNR